MRHSPVPAAQLPPETVARVRELYSAGELTIAEICRVCGVTEYTLYYWVNGGPRSGPRHLEPLPHRIAKIPRSGHRRRLRGDRASLVKRMWRAAEAQVRDIEERLLRDAQPADERERDARVLAVLGKTMRDLGAFDQTQADAAPRKDASRDDDDPIPRDVDELRRELARKVEILRRRRADAGPPGGDGA
jgi:transposase-like protein